MKYKFYTTSEKAWDAMIEAIAGAQKSIFIEMYIFVDNTVRHDFFKILEEKAEKGVKVKIIIDSFGSLELSQKTIEKLKSTGVELLFFSYWLRHTHKKILIIDEKIAFLGGVNIHKLFQKWNDLQMRFTGPIVKSVIRSFAKSYLACGGKDPDILIYRKRKGILKKTDLRFLSHQQAKGNNLLKKHYKNRLNNAKRGIIIVTPYFAPHRWLMGVLHQAVLRGVSIEILLPRQTDHWIFDRVNYFYISKFYNLGVKFYLQEEMLHAKVMIIDGVEGMVGSQNIDPFSFNYNLEAGAFFRDEKMVKDLIKIIADWKKDSTVFSPEMYKRTWSDYFLAPIIRLVLSII
ncbi:MAG: phosphatidylserine/phosphatidylglycerophosphate/cardiolipin synthase family protein [Patescibacteria group bacterium]